jgi:hypothetical protein
MNYNPLPLIIETMTQKNTKKIPKEKEYLVKRIS